jgi:hypothetical protein
MYSICPRDDIRRHADFSLARDAGQVGAVTRKREGER